MNPRRAVWLLAVLLAASVLAPLTRAQTFTVLYSFTGRSDGASPQGALLLDPAGNLYGAAPFGGSGPCHQGNHSGCGTVFKLDTAGNLTVLHSFSGADGISPQTTLTRGGNGNLYGTTEEGGAHGRGTVFKIDSTGQETVLYSFTGGGDGGEPSGGVVADGAGNVYGTTVFSAQHNGGGVFKVNRAGQARVLYSFTGKPDGASPRAGVIRDAAGNLYGTTYGGGAFSCGSVFKLDAAGNETVLHSFRRNAQDGGFPLSGLIRDAAGNLYGTTYQGGPHDNGTVFKLDTAGNETILHNFWLLETNNGAYPGGSLLMDAAGNLYGTTEIGGFLGGGAGTVFKIDTAGNFTLLHQFTGGAGGATPVATLIMDAEGNLYGVTLFGGTGTPCSEGCGTVFKLTP